MVYDDQCDFTESRRVKSEVRSRYERGMGHAMLEDEEEPEQEEGAGGNRELVNAIYALNEEMGRMQLRMQGMMGDMFQVTEELQRVIGHHNTSAAPPPDEHYFLAQPITGPVSENNSTPPILPNAHGTINPPTPTTDNWIYQPSFNTPTESTWMPSNNAFCSDTHPYQFPAVPEAGTPTAGTTRARTDIYLFDPAYQDDSGPQYIEGSSTGLSARETGEIWQRDFADNNEGMD